MYYTTVQIFQSILKYNYFLEYGNKLFLLLKFCRILVTVETLQVAVANLIIEN